MDQVKESPCIGASKGLPDFPHQDMVRLDLEGLDQILRYCLDNGVEDLILLSGSPWSVMWSSKVVFRGTRPLTTEEIEHLLVAMTSNPNAGLDLFRAEPIDFNYNMNLERGRSVRFRCSAVACLGPRGKPGIEIVMRPSSKGVPSLSDLDVPEYITNACMPQQGIVLVCGPTGSGKTTLLDAILRELATSPEGKHILTFFAPIENDLNNIPGRTGLISQCEIGRQGYGAHLTSFPDAVRNSLRRHPHVIVFGEARDPETIEGAVLSSMTGHATYTTTHTSNVHMAISRMADSFKGADRIRIINGLIDNTRLIVHQRLVKRPNGIGRAPVRSALVITQEMRRELLLTPVDRLPAVLLDMTRRFGIGLLEDATRQYERGLIHKDELIAIEAELKVEEEQCL